MISRSDFKLRCHEIGEQLSPIHSSSQVLKPSLVVNFGVETTYRQNRQGVLWRYIAGNLKHIVWYVGAADADLWRSGIFCFQFFVARNVNSPRPLAKAENWTKMQAGREWACWNKHFDTKERSCYNSVFAIYNIVFYRVLNLHERQLCWNTDLIVQFGTRSKPAILLLIFEHDKSHSLKTQRLVNNFKPSRQCISLFPAIIQPDKCHVSHRKQSGIRLTCSRQILAIIPLRTWRDKCFGQLL